MNPKFHHLLILVAAAGLCTGLAVRRSTARAPASPDISHSTRSASEKPTAELPPPAAAFPPRHSTDTLETLAALDDANLYARLALWLVDASEPDIAAFWSGCYSKKEDWTPEISNLLFLHWTRLDPQHAIDSTQGIHSRPNAWWAWACHDPQAALAAAIADGPGSVDCVAEGIGKFQPDWLLKHFDEIPTGAQHSAIRSLNEDGGKNPLETLKFLQQQGSDIHPGTLNAFAREDPWAAVEWARQNPNSGGDPFSEENETLLTIIQALAEESPDELARIAERTPSGEDKLKMESALFAHLLKTDPAAALEQAKATTVPRTAAERYAAIGQSLVHTDPAQALQFAQALLTVCPGALDLSAPIEYPDRTSHPSFAIPGVLEFMNSLMVRQPQQVMEMIAALPPELAKDQLDSYSRQWVQQDLVGYTDWVNQQTDTAIRQSGVSRIVSALRESSHYQEAAEWAASMDLRQTADLDGVLSRWLRQDPEAPARWLENADLPPERKAIIQTLLDRPR
ncbi:MAG: hypothetical protein V4689_06535 [Verrucomicrobiota bacterium]